MITRANLESEDEEKMKNEKIVAMSFLKKKLKIKRSIHRMAVAAFLSAVFILSGSFAKLPILETERGK